MVQYITLNSKISYFVLHRWKFPFNWISSYIKYKPEMLSGGWGFAGFHFVRWHLNTDRSLMILKQSWREIFCVTFRTLMRFNNIAGKFCQSFFSNTGHFIQSSIIRSSSDSLHNDRKVTLTQMANISHCPQPNGLTDCKI